MRCWILGVLLAACGATSVSAQDDCAAGRPNKLDGLGMKATKATHA